MIMLSKKKECCKCKMCDMLCDMQKRIQYKLVEVIHLSFVWLSGLIYYWQV